MCREHVAQLCHYQDEFARLEAQVVVISFGTPALARRWIEETCSPFTMLLDQEREVYRAYGVKRSWIRSWNPGTVWFYARMLASGRKWRGIQGDPNQLGGDFIVDSDGTMRFVHPSRTATDRPAVAELLDLLRERERRGADG